MRAPLKMLMSHQRYVCCTTVSNVLPAECAALPAHDMKSKQLRGHHLLRLHMLQFLKGQKVFALTDGRLFWHKEGEVSLSGGGMPLQMLLYAHVTITAEASHLPTATACMRARAVCRPLGLAISTHRALTNGTWWEQVPHKNPDFPLAGTYAEYVCTRESYLAHQPSALSFEEAGGVPLAALTAYQVRGLARSKPCPS